MIVVNVKSRRGEIGSKESAVMHEEEQECDTERERDDYFVLDKWANPRGNAIRGRPVDGVEQAHSTRPVGKNTGNFVGLNLETVAEITLQRTDTTHDLSSESREAINIHAHST